LFPLLHRREDRRCFFPQFAAVWRVFFIHRGGDPPLARAGLSLKVTSENDGKRIAIKNERQTMHFLISPVLASALYIGGGSVGLLLVIVVVVLLLRR
jgi:hypothetical protein